MTNQRTYGAIGSEDLAAASMVDSEDAAASSRPAYLDADDVSVRTLLGARDARSDAAAATFDVEGPAAPAPPDEWQRKLVRRPHLLRCFGRLSVDPLLAWTLVGVAVGVAAGFAMSGEYDAKEDLVLVAGFPGRAFLNLLKMLVLPLLSLSIIAGVASLASMDGGAPGGGMSARRVGRTTLAYYAGTTAVAVVIGIAVVSTFRPGDHTTAGPDCSGGGSSPKPTPPPSAPDRSTLASIIAILAQAFPPNIVAAAVDMNVLGIVSASAMAGAVLAAMQSPTTPANSSGAAAAATEQIEEGIPRSNGGGAVMRRAGASPGGEAAASAGAPPQPKAEADSDATAAAWCVRGVGRLNRVVTAMVTRVLWLTPLGVGSLVCASVAESCAPLQVAASLGRYALCVLFALGLQGLVVLPLVHYACCFGCAGLCRGRGTPPPSAAASLEGREDERAVGPGGVFGGFAKALVTAFGTDSSSATLPVTMACARDMGVSPGVVDFVLPLGATVNMNGTALYEALTVLFIAQMHGVALDGAQVAVVALTATVAAVGAAAIPSAGLVTMVLVLQSVGMAEYAGDVALVMTIDWFLDRCRTVVNVAGDAFGCVIVDHMAKTHRR